MNWCEVLTLRYQVYNWFQYAAMVNGRVTMFVHCSRKHTSDKELYKLMPEFQAIARMK